MPKMKKNF